MADDKTNKGPQDRSRINVNEPYEVEYWSNRFGVTPAQLRTAVEDVGVNAKSVEERLKNKK